MKYDDAYEEEILGEGFPSGCYHLQVMFQPYVGLKDEVTGQLFTCIDCKRSVFTTFEDLFAAIGMAEEKLGSEDLTIPFLLSRAIEVHGTDLDDDEPDSLGDMYFGTDIAKA